jgi:DNA-binding Xre family transcriptional regulator
MSDEKPQRKRRPLTPEERQQKAEAGRGWLTAEAERLAASAVTPAERAELAEKARAMRRLVEESLEAIDRAQGAYDAMLGRPRQSEPEAFDSPLGSLQKAFGDNLRRIRQDSRISQRELAALSGISATRIAVIESSGGNVKLDTVEVLAKYLGVQPYQLLLIPRPIRR